MLIAIAQERHVVGHHAPCLEGKVEHGMLVEIEEVLERLHAAMDKRLDQFRLDEHHATLEILRSRHGHHVLLREAQQDIVALENVLAVVDVEPQFSLLQYQEYQAVLGVFSLRTLVFLNMVDEDDVGVVV